LAACRLLFTGKGAATRPVTIDNVTYPSVRAAARSLGVCHATVLKWLAKGTTTDRRMRPVHLQGKSFASRKAAALALGVDPTTINRWLRD